MLEGDAQGEGILGRETDLRGVAHAPVERLGAADHIELLGAVGGEGGGKGPKPGRHEVLGPDRVAVGPAGLRSKVKTPCQPIGGMLP